MASPLTGQVAVTGTAQALSATPVTCVAFSIKAPKTNTLAVFIGGPGVTTTTGHALDPGETFIYERNTQNGQPRYDTRVEEIYVVGTSPDRVSWLASP